MKGRLSMTESRSGGAFLTDDRYQCVPMAIAGRLPWLCGGCRLTRGDVLVSYKGIVLCFP